MQRSACKEATLSAPHNVHWYKTNRPGFALKVHIAIGIMGVKDLGRTEQKRPLLQANCI